MPLTFPAHQGLIAGVKLRWPAYIDATALCIGAATPDLAYPLGSWMNRQSHTVVGLLVWAIPVAVVASIVLRRWAAPGLFATLPDLGPLKLRSYAVLSERRPVLLLTVGSAALGSASHAAIDGFTHTGRWGANWLGLNGTAFTAPIRGTMSWARVLQYLGHAGGTVLFIVMLIVIASSGRLERWYGVQEVERARAPRPSSGQRFLFVAVAVAPALFAVAITGRAGVDAVFLAQTVLVPSIIAAGVLVTHLLMQETT